MISLRGRDVLVTGASGLLGRPLVDALIKRGAKVYGVGFEPRPSDWPNRVSYASLDLSELAGWYGLLYQVDYVFHLAGAKGGVGIGQNRAADFMRGNIISTLNMFTEWLSEPSPPSRLLFVSSVGAYPGSQDIFREDEDIWAGAPHQSDFFGGVAKRVGEALCEAHRKQCGLDYVIVRPTNCYGPYDRFDAETGMAIAALIARIEAGERPLKVWGDGTARRDFLYSKDCAEGMIRAMESGRSGEAYNLGRGAVISVGLILEALALLYPGLTWTFDTDRPSGPAARQMDMTKSARELGWPEFTSHVDALRETVEWYRANKNYQKYDPFKEIN